MRTRLIAAAALLPTLILTGCSGGAPSSDPGNPAQLEVLTWMTSGAEAGGLAALADTFHGSDPGIQFLDASVAGGHDVAWQAIGSRLAAGDPPDSFQVRAGAELSQYVREGELADLSGVYADAGLTAAFPPELIDQLTVGGRIYAIPAGLQRSNVVWSAISTLDEAGIPARTPAGDMRAWLGDLGTLRARGMEFPLAVGDASRQLQLFECVLIAELGFDQYVGLWNGQTRWDGEAVKRAVATYGALLEFVDPAMSRAHDDRVIAALTEGEAAYVVAPGTADSAFASLGWEYGTDYAAAAVPGTSGVFAFAAETFVVPTQPSHRDAALRWVRAVGSEQGQLALSAAIGVIPARADVAPESAYLRAAQASLDFGHLAPSLSLGTAAGASWTTAIRDAVAGFVRDGRSAALESALVAAADEALVVHDGADDQVD